MGDIEGPGQTLGDIADGTQAFRSASGVARSGCRCNCRRDCPRIGCDTGGSWVAITVAIGPGHGLYHARYSTRIDDQPADDPGQQRDVNSKQHPPQQQGRSQLCLSYHGPSHVSSLPFRSRFRHTACHVGGVYHTGNTHTRWPESSVRAIATQSRSSVARGVHGPVLLPALVHTVTLADARVARRTTRVNSPSSGKKRATTEGRTRRTMAVACKSRVVLVSRSGGSESGDVPRVPRREGGKGVPAGGWEYGGRGPGSSRPYSPP